MFLGLDIGTSSVKAVIADEHDSVFAQTSAPLTVSRPRPLFSEQDPESWWRGCIDAIWGLPSALRKSVKAVGLSGQMHGATLLDKSDRLLRPAILWNDGRSVAECAELEQLQPRARSITGNLIMPGFTAPKLLWVHRHEPEIFRQIGTVLLPKDYVRFRLTGEKVSDMSDASGSAWLDVAARDWSEEMLEATGLARAQMPKLVEGNAPSGTLCPEVAEELGLPRVLVAGGGGDNAASAVGMGVVQPGQAFLSLGTSGVLFAVTDRFRPNPDRAAHAFCHCLPNLWHQMSVMLTAASALDWIAGVVGVTGFPEFIASAESAGLHSESPIFLPYLSGERTPHNDPNARGVFFGMNSQTRAADLAAAVLEGVAFGFVDGLEVLLEGGGKVDEISVIGGGARLPYWGKILASALGRPMIYRRGGEVGAAFGAARLARLAYTGEVLQAVCPAPPIDKIVQPDPELAGLLAERRRIFVQLYPALKNGFAEFSR